MVLSSGTITAIVLCIFAVAAIALFLYISRTKKETTMKGGVCTEKVKKDNTADANVQGAIATTRNCEESSAILTQAKLEQPLQVGGNTTMWHITFKEHINEMKKICQSSKPIKDNFLSMWLLENVGHKRFSWDDDDALRRCITPYTTSSSIDSVASQLSEYAKKNMLLLEGTALKNITEVPENVVVPKHIAKKFKKEPDDKVRIMWYVYDTFMTYTERNMQLAMPTKMYKTYRMRYKIKLEGFASPINHFFAKFCSAFYEVDKYFGSVGSFFDVVEHLDENIVCNPPFEEEVMEETYKCLEKALERALDKNKSLTAILIVPQWDDAKCIKLANNSKYLSSKQKYAKDELEYFSYADDKGINAVDTYVYVFKGNVETK